VVALWPYAASARTELRLRRPRMPEYLEHARAVASALAGLESVRVLPDPPQTSMMHLQLDVSPAELRARAVQLAEKEGIWTFPEPYAVDSPGSVRLELSVGDATLGFEPAEVRDLVQHLAGGRT